MENGGAFEMWAAALFLLHGGPSWDPQSHLALLSPTVKWISQSLSWLLAKENKRRAGGGGWEGGEVAGGKSRILLGGWDLSPLPLVFYSPQNIRKMMVIMKIANVYRMLIMGHAPWLMLYMDYFIKSTPCQL